MWGKDSPFAVLNGNTYAAAFELVHDRLGFLSAEDRDWLLGRTAERMFFA